MKSNRFKQANREALASIGLFVLYFLWWTIFAFGLDHEDPETFGYTLGLPDWFFYSCVLGYPVITALLWLTVRLVFKDLPLDDSSSPEGAEGRTEGGRTGNRTWQPPGGAGSGPIQADLAPGTEERP